MVVDQMMRGVMPIGERNVHLSYGSSPEAQDRPPTRCDVIERGRQKIGRHRRQTTTQVRRLLAGEITADSTLALLISDTTFGSELVR